MNYFYKNLYNQFRTNKFEKKRIQTATLSTSSQKKIITENQKSLKYLLNTSEQPKSQRQEESSKNIQFQAQEFKAFNNERGSTGKLLKNQNQYYFQNLFNESNRVFFILKRLLKRKKMINLFMKNKNSIKLFLILFQQFKQFQKNKKSIPDFNRYYIKHNQTENKIFRHIYIKSKQDPDIFKVNQLDKVYDIEKNYQNQKTMVNFQKQAARNPLFSQNQHSLNLKKQMNEKAEEIQYSIKFKQKIERKYRIQQNETQCKFTNDRKNGLVKCL